MIWNFAPPAPALQTLREFSDVSTARPTAVIVLAAGEGTRMRSRLPKVLHELAGRSLLGHAIAAGRELDPEHLVVVVRHARDAVVAEIAARDPQAIIADQDDVAGTGRAVQCAMEALRAELADAGLHGPTGTVVVIAADTPLLDGATLTELVAAHAAGRCAATVLTTEVVDPTGYGRVLREAGTGEVLGIVEHRDADAAQREITEINTSVYAFDAEPLAAALAELRPDNAQGELYLTDVLAVARRSGGVVKAIRSDDPAGVEGVNDRVQLATAGAELNRRILTSWMLAGVTVVDPATTWVDVDVDLAADVTLLPGTQLRGATTVAEGATIGPDTTLVDVEVGAGAQVVRTHAQLAVIGRDATVGPFSYLRPGTVLGAGGKIGAYVETKNADIGDGTKVPHLSYVGDATIGQASNIGAGTIFVNYDGVTKRRSTVGSQVRIGSDTTLVAPVTIGDGAYTGAGAVIRHDVPPGALSFSSGPQRVVEGWVLRRRPDTSAADVAREALGADATAKLPDAVPDGAPGQDTELTGDGPGDTHHVPGVGAEGESSR